jgi:hypothetical protein
VTQVKEKDIKRVGRFIDRAAKSVFIVVIIEVQVDQSFYCLVYPSPVYNRDWITITPACDTLTSRDTNPIMPLSAVFLPDRSPDRVHHDLFTRPGLDDISIFIGIVKREDGVITALDVATIT